MNGFRTLVRVVAASTAAALLAACSDEPEIDEQPLEPETPIGDARPAFVGVWAADPEWCDAEPGSADPSPIEFTEVEIVGYESRCTIAEMEEGTEGGWRLTLACLGEGVVYDEMADVDVDGEMMRFTRGEGEATALTRCDSPE